MVTYTDETRMPFGMHKGKALANVPAKYLLYLYNNNLDHVSLRQYIEANMDALKKEAGLKAKVR